ncbi:VOC family protein [Alkalihalophilus marmarensis]|uniref:VOC family protein n=1 Tax=Alkalihalophilus marmarensis TaxID=521377 RepID=UPI002DBEB5EC|nr:VOC family protein [Alkalihalophilus marmarensis]MEC2074072.1 VOC family protein [Alkalihalophilus marmarensis]
MIKALAPYIVTNGNGQEAVEFYKNAFNAELIGVQTFGDMPPNPEYPLPEEAKDRVMHGALQVGDTRLMISDTFPGQPYELGSQVTIAMILNDVEKSKEVFSKLSDGGNVTMELQETFWSPSYGQVTDKFGVSWQITTEVE